MYFRKYRFRKTSLYKCLKSHVTEDPSTNNMANGSKHCCNLKGSTFIIFFNHGELNYVVESLFC